MTNFPQDNAFLRGGPTSGSADASIAICSEEPMLAERIASSLRHGGYSLARSGDPASLLSAKRVAGLIDLLIVDVDQTEIPNKSHHWRSLMKHVQPTIGCIAITRRDESRWIIDCIRQGALNCHILSDGNQQLQDLVSEYVGRNEKGLDNLKTVEERRQATLSYHLRQAIEREAIEVYFQPIVNTGDWNCDRVESLARWNDADLGSVSPGEFIATAEREGLVENLGILVLKKSLQSLVELQKSGHSPTFSINVSRRQFENPRLVETYLKAVIEAGASPEQIIIEVTETASFSNYTLALSLMRDFVDAGFRLAVDDFGTGESSFMQMSHVAYSELKIDRSLVSCIFEPAGQCIMRSIIAMGKSLNMHLVAEGVEDRQTADLLEQLEVDFCQGYFFARPMPQADLLSYFNDLSKKQGQNLKPLA
ncbi:EAL domain-containing protein [Pelagicoccus sp. SDUM812003]|uniref:EAL domain-containing protein n=1 Tax=Pelagicoccus sp. SDUM812003 TaxID=3041267 RepID=UPI00280F5075|nr:EAL domain-containing protein [Pelagicoccus sp. SDUM812003]MDQ8203035.1 EAL domain-containing protein [Pelagicoccus sp. SDUM812003]